MILFKSMFVGNKNSVCTSNKEKFYLVYVGKFDPNTPLANSVVVSLDSKGKLTQTKGYDPLPIWSGEYKEHLEQELKRNFNHLPKWLENNYSISSTECAEIEILPQDPIEAMDKIFSVYSKSFNKTVPDAEMAEVVTKTKDMLFDWWADHCDVVRKALVEYKAQ
jgi:hypothetical protein